MTFLGFLLNDNGDLLDPGSKSILEDSLMPAELRRNLKKQGVDFGVNYEISGRLVSYYLNTNNQINLVHIVST